MQNLMKGRRLEVLLVFGCIAIYVVKRLFQEAHAFDTFIFDLYKLPTEQRNMWLVWRALDDYSHLGNTIFPIVSGGFLFFAAWYVFHIWFFPRLKSRELSASTLIFGVFALLLVVASVFLYSYFKLYYEEIVIRDFHFQSPGKPEMAYDKINGAWVYSNFRKLHLLTNSVAVILILCLYEALAQGFYFIKTKLAEEDNNALIGHILEACIVVFMLVIAAFGNLPRKDFWNGPIREMCILGLMALTVWLSQDFFYRKCLPFIGRDTKLYSSNFAIYFLLIFGGSVLVHLFQTLFWTSHGFRLFRFSVPYFFMIFGAIFIGSLVVAYARKFLAKENTLLKTEISQKTAELGNLRSQINPHFLFNALNTLYSVSLKENAARTSDGIQKLGDMMRFMLHENHQDRIPLAKEIEYLNNFIEIQRMRIDESHDIKIEVNIQNPDREIFIAPMLLNPFVENAFKHGISFRSPSWIYITLTHDAQHLFFKVHNSIHPKAEELDNSHGIGLENVKKRLELIYPNRHKLEIQATDHDFFVSLVLGVY
jgi:two-component system, LytTR family, sensor kinase